MRLWTLHPILLDQKGLTAVWREALLARAVLRGRTVGYRSHPQLARFRQHQDPVGAINTYLDAIHAEAFRRGYAFDGKKIRGRRTVIPILATRGQLEYEWKHLLHKLRLRSPQTHASLVGMRPRPHPLFRIVRGPVAEWEVVQAGDRTNVTMPARTRRAP